jgi:hypothetical protein
MLLFPEKVIRQPMDNTLRHELRSAVAPFERPVAATSVVQFVSTLALYVGCCALMYWSLSLSYAVTLALAFPAAAFLIRLFIVQHDCGHGSFFLSQRANTVVGRICSVFTLAPYASWRRQHAAHHANWNNLDRRESGADIYSSWLTVKEFRALSRWRRLMHRVALHPLVAHGVLPPAIFLLLYRAPFDTPKSWTRERRSVYATNLAIAAIVLPLVWTLSLGAVIAVQLPIVAVRRSASLRQRTLLPPGRLELCRRVAARLVIPQAAAGSAMGHRQYRFSSHSPPRATHPELSSRILLSGERGAAERSAADDRPRPAFAGTGAVGRTAAEVRPLLGRRLTEILRPARHTARTVRRRQRGM